METSIFNGVCRCCASEGTFKDIKSSYLWMGEEEVYGDMLKDCFDITLSTSNDGRDSGICEVCITQLRNAVNFKKQVLQTEEQIKKQFQSVFFKPNIIKVEVPGIERDDIDDDNLSAEEAFSGTDMELPIKMESEEAVSKPKKRKANAKGNNSTTRSKKSKTNDGETSKNQGSGSEAPIICVEDHPVRLTLDRKLNFSSFIAIRPVGKRTLPSMRKKQQRICNDKRLKELDWHFDNIRTILKCSNATPMRCKVGKRFACSYCLDQFDDPGELRSHTASTHTKDKPSLFNLRSLSKHIVYLDITSLSCSLCALTLKSLDELMDHLKSVHDEIIHKQIKNQIVPYVYDGIKSRCGVCLSDLDEVEDFQDHMSEHYKNFNCEFCNSSFIIKMKMIEHKKNVHRV